MTAISPSTVRVIVADGSAAAGQLDAVRALLEKGYAVSRVRSTPAAAGPDDVLLGSDLLPETEPASVLAALGRLRSDRGLPEGGAWKPWFPVIDYTRCTNCMQCLSFCLFEVYGVSGDKKIQVQNQSNCKTECPACSRVCPEVAIMFPKYRHGPINGEPVNEDDIRREAMKVDISALLGGDVYAMLRDRSARAKSRFSKERDDERALKERQTCLATLRQSLDVPAEVLAALPSPDEIRAKAEAAAVRAAAAVQQATETERHGDRNL